MAIEPYTHHCTVISGPLAGNKHAQTVSSFAVERGLSCDNCGQTLAAPTEVIAHIYQYLLEQGE